MKDNKALIRMLHECAEVCDNCYDACLNEKNVSMMVRCIELDRECSDICQWTASMLARDSEHSESVLMVCAEICEACAEECAKHEHEHCQKCASVCAECSRHCREMAEAV